MGNDLVRADRTDGMDTAVITGGSSGIGRAVAELFAQRGVHVVTCARDRDGIEAVAAEADATDGSVTALRADVRDEFDVERLMETAARTGGTETIDCVIANAGVYHGSAGETPLADESYSAFDDTLRTNVRGVFATFREAVPHLATDARAFVPSGRIAREATAGYGAYAVSKAASEAIARQFAAESGTPTAVLDLGRVATDLTGDGEGRDPADVAPMFWWAATEADDETVDGAVLGLGEWKAATR
jgi:NAD(P)-dependent dehydrogenase (short-subunit alcohol dehydrogenase family)